MNEWELGERLSDSVGELSTYDQHPSDLGSETFERGKDIALRESAARLLGKTKEALDRIDEGSYGLCKECGCTIPLERLSAVPYAVRCVECQAGEEEAFLGGRRPRPVEEDVLSPPFGRSFRQDDYVAFDGEDTWQAVARFGTANSPQDLLGAVEIGESYVGAHEDSGIVQDVDALPDLGGDGVSELDEIYPEISKRRRRVPPRSDLGDSD